jgi:oligopeptide/dipeptide ABC transporter ATP-binding protein
MTLLSVENLITEFKTASGPARAVNGVTFSVSQGEILGLVGESGSGKSVTALSILGLLDPEAGRVASGRAVFDGEDLVSMPAPALRALRGKRVGMIFQEPLSALNPCYTIENQISEVFVAHGERTRLRARVLELLKLVQIPDPEGVLKRYPHEISGGMRQRAMIAMSLAYEPDLLIADEPTTALDVTIQAQVLNLIEELRHKMGLAVILITHDMGVVAQYTDRVAVMYGGRIVETGDVTSIFATPAHPYTRGLLKSLPQLGARWKGAGTSRLAEIPGFVPAITEVLPGCRFAPRCPLRIARSSEEVPPIRPMGETQAAACWRAGEKA